MADSNAIQLPGLEVSGLETDVVYLSAKEVVRRYRMAYSTFQKHLRVLALSRKYPGAFKFTEPLSKVIGEGREYYRIDIHPVRGIEVLDKHFGYVERYGVRRGV